MVSAETLTIAALLIAPGVIAILIGITLGVVEKDVSRDQLYLTSFVSSIGIDVVFIWIAQWRWGMTITDRVAIETVFFGDEQFNVGAAALLFVLSCLLGVIYGIGLTYNVSHYFREKMAFFRSHRRNPWQPWEGSLRDAEEVMVELKNGDDVIGMLAEYSRVEKERQIVLQSPQFLDFEDSPNREKIIIPENEIALVHVMTTQERKGVWNRGKAFLSRSKGSVQGLLLQSNDDYSDEG
ncbi:DUF6338 family protein [Halostagnicola kamekurae]|uniref:Uncharacterized protein n=1 Tax=Halostagnicola kamekurae TaxID=619731 RepID=A0A1I6UNI6_9EURY|nr:DUF6338 family protein [Halostagnicola kamekurae]SFT02924.1 hypothetical protein SAMN04488556_3955 [Halostagnicola kamekurae]